MAAAQNNNTSAEIGKRLFNGEQAKDIAAELGIDTSSFSRSQPQYYKAYIAALQTELNAAQTTATQLQGVNNGLQKSCEKLQAAVTELQANVSTTAVTSEQMQAMETNLQLTANRLQQSETNLQAVTSQLQTKASELQIVETERQLFANQLHDTTEQLQIVETDRNQLANELQALAKVRKPIVEQFILTHARFLLWAIIGFETYNAWQLLSNMELQSFPYPMAVVFSMFFGLASVTALAANHRWGVILCVTAAFFSNAIHADLFGSLSLSGLFYTLLPCLLILLFADMYKKNNIY
jgi:DNA repair exonuclease SbcCD ATPase subunit